jgi:Fic family protein
MHIPENPPEYDSEELFKMGGDKVLFWMASLGVEDSKKRYLHWDEMKRHDPPEGLDHRTWWMVIREQRRLSSRLLRLFHDTQGRAFSFCEPDSLRVLMMKIDRLSGGLVGAYPNSVTPEDGKIYLQRSLVEEPFHSALIEGAATTRAVAKEMIESGRRPKTIDEKMTYNNFLAMQMVKELAHEPLSIPFVLELHRIVTQGTLDNPDDAGRLRLDNRVNVYDEQSGDILHRPPSYDLLPDRLGALCRFANRKEDDSMFIHPVLKAMLLHFMLAYDHPFVNGNGRTARALFYWSMLRSGYWLSEYVSISSVIAEAKVKYGHAFLKTETDRGDLTYFFLHQADVLHKALVRLHDYLDKKKQVIKEMTAAKGHVLNQRQLVIIEEIKNNRARKTTIAEHQKRFGVSYLTARADLLELVDYSLLERFKSGKQFIFVARPQKA